MNSKYIYLVAILNLFFVLFGCLSCQSSKNIIAQKVGVKEIWVYNYFEITERSRGDVNRKFIDLEHNNCSKIRLSEEDENTLRNVLNGLKGKWYPIVFIDDCLIFLEIITDDNQKIQCTLSKSTFADVTKQRYGIISDIENQSYIQNMLERISSGILKYPVTSSKENILPEDE